MQVQGSVCSRPYVEALGLDGRGTRFTANRWVGDYFRFLLHRGIAATDPDHDRGSGLSRPLSVSSRQLPPVGVIHVAPTSASSPASGQPFATENLAPPPSAAKSSSGRRSANSD